jgi:MFS family permease
MAGSTPEDQPETAHRRPHRPRPMANATQRTRTAPVQRADPAPDQEAELILDDIIPIQTLSVEIQPIGGIFGTATPVADDEQRRSLRSVRRKRSVTLRQDEESLFASQDFRALWLSRLFAQSAQGALLYALLILVVDLSDRSVFNSLFVICSIIPSIVFGLPAGLAADTFPRRGMLVMLNLFRFGFMLMMVATEVSLAGVFATTLGIWIIHQFYSPTEASVLADLVPPDRYTAAQAMFNLALTISQVAGLILMAPILLRVGGPTLVFVFSGILWLLAGALVVTLPTMETARARVRNTGRSLRQMLGDGWRFTRGDRLTFEAMIDDLLVGVGMSGLIVIIPYYLERVLGIAKENTVFVFAPAALGLVLGLRSAPRLARFIGEPYLATLGLFLFALVVAALGFVDQTYRFLNDTLRLPLDDLSNLIGISPLIILAMMLSIPAGFASAVVNVAARSILLKRTPGPLRGQVIATQNLVQNIASLLPTLLAGLATDAFGVKPIAVAIAVLIVVCAMGAHAMGRRSERASVLVPQT